MDVPPRNPATGRPSALPATLNTADGLKLHLQVWPAAEPARGTALIVHGLGEHIGRYAHVAAKLNAWGWWAVGYDHRGHGRSDGARGGLHHVDDLLEDLGRVIDSVRAARPGPLLLLGHSLGGLVAARFVAGGIGTPEAWYRPVDGLVLSSPALDPGMNPGQKLLLALLGRLAPNLGVGNGLKPEWISRDAAVVQRYTDDALVHDRVTPRLARFVVDSARVVRERAPRWTLPTLLLYAGSDRCVAPGGSAGFAAAAPQALLATHEFRALYHEIFNEPEQAQVFDRLREWLARQGPDAAA
jgi:alpha-beta hydrolase superfamily lysophospholipase